LVSAKVASSSAFVVSVVAKSASAVAASSRRWAFVEVFLELEAFAARVLGTPKSVRWAIVKLWLLVGILSAVVNNTPMIAMMIPVLEMWTQRLGLDISQLAMPMAFASQMGGSLTLMGSPTNFASQHIFALQNPPYQFGFFEMSLHATILFFVGLAYAIVFAPRLLKSPGDQAQSSNDAQLLAEEDATEAMAALPAFEVVFKILPHSIFEGARAEDAGFQRLPGVLRVQNIVREGIALSGQDADETRSVATETQNANAWRNVKLKGQDLIVFGATAEGIAALRATRGLILPMEHEILKLGARRRQRLLFEVELSPTSKLIGQRVRVENFRFEHKCAVIAVRHRLTARGGTAVGIDDNTDLPRRSQRTSMPLGMRRPKSFHFL